MSYLTISIGKEKETSKGKDREELLAWLAEQIGEEGPGAEVHITYRCCDEHPPRHERSFIVPEADGSSSEYVATQMLDEFLEEVGKERGLRLESLLDAIRMSGVRGEHVEVTIKIPVGLLAELLS